MSILRNDLAGLDFSDIADMSQGRMPPIHPGAFLSEILDDLAVSQSAFAKSIGVSPMRVSHIIKGTRPVTAELALCFAKAFGQSPQYWMNLQAAFDLSCAESAMGERLQAITTLAHA